MRRSTGLGSSTLLAALWCTTAAWADITPEEVWQGWIDLGQGFGQTVTTAASERQGDTLVVSGVSIAQENAGMSANVTIDEVRLRDMGDGRVEVTMSPSIPFGASGAPEGGDAVQMNGTISQTGMSLIASGSADDVTYDYSAPMFSLNMEAQDGTQNTPLNLSVDMADASGSYHVLTDGGQSGTSSFDAASVSYQVSGKDAANSSAFTFTGSTQGLSGTGEFFLPEGVDMQNLAEALKAGLRLAGSYGYTSGEGQSVIEGPEAGNVSFSGGAGTLRFAMSSDGLNYGGDSGPMSMQMQLAEFPVPMDFSVGQSAFDLAMPVEKSDEPQPFGLVLKLIDLEVSDALWGMFDPTQQLPRDPATLIIDVAGNGKLGIDVFDPAQAQSIADQPPGEVSAVTINELRLSAVGAELTGSGSATIDNTGPVPVPDGSVDLRLVGANALMQKLVAMGLMPQDQMMGAQMMLGLFAVPDGEDALASKIEFKEDGRIFANGQQIQ
ncbi:DUF2125 domain-containing protein [Defluviimonas sp. WL0002]|uniref:DUF2125 domain-containing protein n=1 Tax=Albidovulum marisflavi TaxID=2984159 RepID=A0ABT2Z7V7_9RHOB|nr:DUF2125 domain-containing protein [Defluviimonas sp. WL0002]MCV2867218.1 DUF2125 domain-containing protein [Defluviimonas sp. WL0002]